MAQTPGGLALPSALPETPPALRACLFAVSGSRFAVDVRSAREVAVFDEITVVPRAPRQLLGVANLRGTVVPIVDAGPLLGLPELRSARSVRTLVLRDGALLAAVAVDNVLGLEPFDDVLPATDPAAPRDHAGAAADILLGHRNGPFDEVRAVRGDGDRDQYGL